MKTGKITLCMAMVCLLFNRDTQAQSLIHYWHFNDNASLTTLLTPQASLVAGAAITAIPGGISQIDVSGGTGQDFIVDNHNARNGDAAGSHLRFNDPIGGELVFSLPTTGYQDPEIKFSTRRSGSGAGLQYWAYTVDGTTFIPFDTIAPANGNPVLISFNFTDSTGVDNNPNFKLKVAFAEGTGGLVGNNRFDNFTMDALVLGGIDITPPVVSFIPVDMATGVAINVAPQINFNEPIRLINNNPVTNANIASLVELRQGNATGSVIPFTATITGNTIDITPTSPLMYQQQYYVSVLPNIIEDFSDNVLTTTESAQFTTIMQQTVFNAGDMAFVAYRMNATATEDEIALLTFVDILPGTVINFTDAKYTDNAQPQCTGGIIWTAPFNECVPAGTIITIQPDAVVTNTGTVTGSGFGLSSGGDQVIVYTGSAANPNYITALTSINWVTANTACGGSVSKKPAGLTDGTTAANISTAPGNVSGNSPNAYYDGSVQTGTAAVLRAAILNPANWVVAGSGTAPQTWPAYAFPVSPAVIQAQVLTQQTVQLIFNTDLNGTAASNQANYTGIPGLTAATVTNNGTAPDTVTLTYSTAFTPGISYTLTVNNILNTAGVAMSCPYTWNFTYTTAVSFAGTFAVVEENVGSYDLVLNLDNPSVSSVELAVMGAPYSTANNNDFTLSTQTLNFTGISNTHVISIPILDDNLEEQSAEYFVLVLRDPSGCVITGDTLATIYIRDNDLAAPAPSGSIELQYIGSFDPSGNNTSTCEVVAYDAASQRLFTTSAITGLLDIIDFSTPATPVTITAVDMNPYGGVTSVAVKDGILAVASPNADEHLPGKVLFFDINGSLINQVTVGTLPDMVTFTPDGTKVLAANEGQPNIDYSIDPEGSVSIIDITGGIAGLTQAHVATLDFTGFNASESALIASGVRKTKSTSTLSQDIEPEYIAVSANSEKAWVTLQENNAIAEINLQTNTITAVWAMGTKDYLLPGNGFDASDNNGEILIANWPVKGFFIPDGMATYNAGSVNYIITANEGDEKEYDGFNERTTVGASNYVLDSAAFPHAAWLKKNHNLGRMRVTNLNGDTDNDGDFDEIYGVGTRSFSIFNADTRTLVYDSGDDFERYVSMTPAFAPIFNSDHEENVAKGRSRSKGPEPEGVTIGELSGKIFAFVCLERTGGVMVYDVTDPAAVQFVDYKNPRQVSAYGGDNGAETSVFISEAHSADGKPYLVVANEVSGTLSIYEIIDNTVHVPGVAQQPRTFNIFPNPACSDNIVYFNRVADVSVTDITGRTVFSGKQLLTLDVSGYMPGIYLVHTADGAVARMFVGKK